jgi:O-antigen ligase
MSLPFALHFALTDSWRPTLRRWYPVAIISVAIMISVSRSAIVSAIVVLCFLMPTWDRRLRYRACAAVLTLLAAAYVAVPGLLGTVAGLFTGISGDSSAQSRTGSYSLAIQFFGRAPFFGRGFQTFLPSYRIFDNQYLLLLVETGLLGLLAFAGLLVSGIVTGMRIWRSSAVDADSKLGIAIAASLASAFVSFALFDAFSFPMATSLLFLILGCAGALRRLHPSRRSVTTTTSAAIGF